MSEAQALLRHYAEVRNRLKRPPNAVPDTGINLQRKDKVDPPSQQLCKTDSTLLLTQVQLSRLETYRNSFCRTDIITFRSVLRFVAEEFGLRYSEITARNRFKVVVIPRQIAIYIGNTLTGHSLAGMGRFLELDHTSVIHARDKVRNKMAKDQLFRGYIKSLEAKLLESLNRSADSAINEQSMAVEPGACTQVPEIFSVDKSCGPTPDDSEEGSHQDVVWELCGPTTNRRQIPETS